VNRFGTVLEPFFRGPSARISRENCCPSRDEPFLKRLPVFCPPGRGVPRMPRLERPPAFRHGVSPPIFLAFKCHATGEIPAGTRRPAGSPLVRVPPGGPRGRPPPLAPCPGPGPPSQGPPTPKSRFSPPRGGGRAPRRSGAACPAQPRAAPRYQSARTGRCGEPDRGADPAPAAVPAGAGQDVVDADAVVGREEGRHDAEPGGRKGVGVGRPALPVDGVLRRGVGVARDQDGADLVALPDWLAGGLLAVAAPAATTTTAGALLGARSGRRRRERSLSVGDSAACGPCNATAPRTPGTGPHPNGLARRSVTAFFLTPGGGRLRCPLTLRNRPCVRMHRVRVKFACRGRRLPLAVAPADGRPGGRIPRRPRSRLP
jgi:hypothetical protein